MQENDFLSQIDCRFPYNSPLLWKRLVAQAPRISDDAAFSVLYELCCPPHGSKLSEKNARHIISCLCKRFKHPLLRVLRPAIESHITGNPISVQKAASLMRQVAPYRSQYTALSICYFAADDKIGKLEPVYERITKYWSMA